MWIAIGVIFTLFLIFTVLWIMDPRSERIPTEVRKVQYWLDKHKNELQSKDVENLQQAIDKVWDILHKREETTTIFYGSCCKVELHDAYETLHTTFFDIYKQRIDKTATTKTAYAALETIKPHRFKVAQEVYVPKHDLHGIIHALNDDDTYTVCDVVEKCYRVNEAEIVVKKSIEGS